MPKSVGFFTPIINKDSPSLHARALQKVDSYFYLGGKKAYVIGQSKDGKDKIVISKSHASALEKTGKILSYITLIIPLVMLGTKAILRCMQSCKVIDPKAKLAKGINITDEQLLKINELLPKIENGENHEDIEWLQKGQSNNVFRLKNDPSIVYKFSKIAENEKRYDNMVKAKTVCLANQLGLLVIPSSQIIDVGTHKLIAEECLDINFDGSAQEELYHTCSSDLNETVKQLATMVTRTGFNDVIWRNVPILNEKEDFQGPRRVALVDLEFMESVQDGFTGGSNRSVGLIGCVTKDQFDIVIKQGRKKGASLSSSDVKAAKKYRKAVLKDDKNLRTFYKDKGIISGREPLDIDIDTLGLNLDKTATASFLDEEQTIACRKLVFVKRDVTLRNVTEDLIAEINKQLQNASENASLKGKRYLLIETSTDPFKEYAHFADGDRDEDSWMHQIIQALEEKQHIYKLRKFDGHGFYIQV